MLNNTLLTNQQITEEILKNETKICIDLKPMGFSKSSVKREEIHSNTSLPQETRETSNEQPNFTFKTARERRKEETQS